MTIRKTLTRFAKIAALLAGIATLVATAVPAAAQRTSTEPIPGMNCHFVLDNSSSIGGYYECYGKAAPAPPPKPDVWGALAVAPDLRVSRSWGFDSKAKAENAVMAECRKATGAQCKLLLSVADICAAASVSEPEKIVKAITSGAKNFAEDGANLQCQRAGGRSCKTQASVCADGENHVLNGTTKFTGTGNPIFVPQGSQINVGPLRR